MGKAVRSDRIRIEVWKCLGDVGAWLLTNLFNNILSIDKSFLGFIWLEEWKSGRMENCERMEKWEDGKL